MTILLTMNHTFLIIAMLLTIYRNRATLLDEDPEEDYNHRLAVNEFDIVVQKTSKRGVKCALNIPMPAGLGRMLDNLDQVVTVAKQLTSSGTFEACVESIDFVDTNYSRTRLEQKAFAQTQKMHRQSSPLLEMVKHDPVVSFEELPGKLRSLTCTTSLFSDSDIRRTIEIAGSYKGLISSKQILRHLFEMVWWRSEDRPWFGRLEMRRIEGDRKSVCRGILARRIQVFDVISFALASSWVSHPGDHFKAMLYNPHFLLRSYKEVKHAERAAWNACKKELDLNSADLISKVKEIVTRFKPY